MIQTGLDVFLESPSMAGPVGVLTSAASRNRDGRTAINALRDAGHHIGAVFAPEHGYFGVGAAGQRIDDQSIGGLMVYSLYGARLHPPPEILGQLSAMIIDLQDVGLRWYSFIATLKTMIEACMQANLPVIVLDRPNPQGGIIVEGRRAEPAFFSSVAPDAMPVRYGLTIGETAQWLNDRINASLDVVTMRGWRRDMVFEDTGLLWSAPSPNMPHAKTALAYAGTCLLEGLNISEGRGTALPFEQIGAPFVSGEVLADALNALHLPGAHFASAFFRPQASKYEGIPCEGVRLHITNPAQFKGYVTGLHMVETLRHLYPDWVEWLAVDNVQVFDRLVGTTLIRESLEQGQYVSDIVAYCDEDALSFLSAASVFWLYE